MKKTKLKKKSTVKISTIKNKIWELVKSHTRSRSNTCYTCQKGPLTGSNYQSGHMIPSSVGGAILRYHPNNIRVQCYYCNINLGGNGSEFYRRMVLERGQEAVEALFRLKQKTVKADILFYEKLLELYTAGVEKDIVDFLEN